VKDARVKVLEDRLSPGNWRVERSDAHGGTETTLFSGRNARQRAFEYADRQYGVREQSRPEQAQINLPMSRLAAPFIVIVNDGQRRWGADRNELFQAMWRIGWRQEADRWYAPDNFPGIAYDELRRQVPEAVGFGEQLRPDAADTSKAQFTTNYHIWSQHDELVYSPGLGANVWVLKPTAA
jgi:hypothetical protein